MTTLLPAYGRDYKNVKAIKADFDANKDFIICNMFDPNNGRYINKQDMQKGEAFQFRYNRQRKVTVLKA